MSTSAQHPLESLYQARDALQAAVHRVQQQVPDQIGDDLGCYAAVNTSILHEFRTLVSVLTEQTQDARSPAVRAAHRELHEVVALFDQISAYVQLHQPTIDALRSPAHQPTPAGGSAAGVEGTVAPA
ncbi:hypothetical protein ABT337_07865 [Saccharopolyspora hirsuta]|uniref:Uncharacterized protein n=1 Tax=Saccharopolyspora hirsuta TaxID=1837 RepID=A0A5M7BZF3_SACHI|nr:hypothetical protein [Saccharopolyspora hirsuta]KAA5835159.1 hypothetical protein F1721_10225 [Saccharopolyspora hirsuta]